jgi:hypothetical protein
MFWSALTLAKNKDLPIYVGFNPEATRLSISSGEENFDCATVLPTLFAVKFPYHQILNRLLDESSAELIADHTHPETVLACHSRRGKANLSDVGRDFIG